MWKHTDGLIEFRRYEATLLLSIHGVIYIIYKHIYFASFGLPK